jgi:hypothetical protein
MLRLKERQRAVLVDKIADAANLAAGAMLFGQAVTGQTFSTRLALEGLGAWAVVMSWSMFLARKER